MTVRACLDDGIERGPIRLRLVTREDAGFVYSLRSDSNLNRYLSPVDGSIDTQRDWIDRYKLREAEAQEYYFVIERAVDRIPCGLVRLYGMTPPRFTWGSWILAPNKPHLGALASALLSFEIGFERLGNAVADIDVRRDNEHAIAFYRRLGMNKVGQDPENLYFEYLGTTFSRDKAELWRHVLGAAK